MSTTFGSYLFDHRIILVHLLCIWSNALPKAVPIWLAELTRQKIWDLLGKVGFIPFEDSSQQVGDA